MSKITNICGEYPEGFKKEDISNDPNFVFTKDPNYSGVKVWDAEGNSVFVNSFQECEHYVSGGWEYNPLQNKEIFYQNSIVVILITLIISKFLYRKYKTRISFLYE